MSWFTDHRPPPDPSGFLQGQPSSGRPGHADYRDATRYSYADARAAIQRALDVYGFPASESDVNMLMNTIGIHAGGEVSFDTLSGIFQHLYENAKAKYGEGDPNNAVGSGDPPPAAPPPPSVVAPPVGASSVVGDYTTPTRPADLQRFTPATWDETYTPPTGADLAKDPAYQAEGSAAARAIATAPGATGTSRPAGFADAAQAATMGSIKAPAFQDLNARAFQNYMTRYNAFMDTNKTAASAFQMNSNTYDQDVTNALNQYLARYGAYNDLIKNNLAYSQLGLDAVRNSAPRPA